MRMRATCGQCRRGVRARVCVAQRPVRACGMPGLCRRTVAAKLPVTNVSSVASCFLFCSFSVGFPRVLCRFPACPCPCPCPSSPFASFPARPCALSSAYPRGPSSLLFSRLLRAALVDMSVYWALWVRLPRAQGRLDLRDLREPRVDLARRARSAASCRPARGAPLPRPLVSFLFSCGPRGCRGQAAAASCCHALFRVEIFVAQCCAFPRGLALPLPCVGAVCGGRACWWHRVPMAMHRVPMAMVFHWLPQKAAIYYYL